MADKFSLGVAGLSHGHVWGLIDRWAEVDGVELAAVADGTEFLEKAAPRFTKSYKSWQEMLDQEELDALLVTSNNVESAEIAVQALGRGIPCMVEKAMAASAADADRMLKAMDDGGVPLMINWPIAWWPVVHEFARRIKSGEIGHVFHFRMRLGHWGPKEIGCDEHFVAWLYDENLNGGGAIADFCGYGAVTARWLFGMPESVYAVRGNFTKDYDVSDDHAICLLKYPKMSAVLEGTWATKGFDDGPTILAHGSEGTLAIYGESVLKKHLGPAADFIDAPELDPGNPGTYFKACVLDGHKPAGVLDPVLAADACRIIDAAKASGKSGCAERP